VSYYTPPAPKPLITHHDDLLAPNASSSIFPSSNPRPRFPDPVPASSPTFEASTSVSSAAHSPANRFSDPRPVHPSSPPDYRPVAAPTLAPAASPAPSSAGIGISLMPDQQVRCVTWVGCSPNRCAERDRVRGCAVQRACVNSADDQLHALAPDRK
jgi:hypothetical protein